MELHDAIARRRTVREFKPDPVPWQTVRRGLQAGLRAPCNAHLKSWQFILLRDRVQRLAVVREKLGARDIRESQEVEQFIARFSDEELKAVYRRALPVQLTMMLQAPEVLLVCYATKPLEDCRKLFDLNPLASVWMCIENIMLALAAEGVHGCTYTPYESQALRDHLGVPTGYEIAAVIPFGYPATEPVVAPDEPLDARLHLDRW
jgi:nitroreductase